MRASSFKKMTIPPPCSQPNLRRHLVEVFLGIDNGGNAFLLHLCLATAKLALLELSQYAKEL
jgi:hypothetical protein